MNDENIGLHSNQCTGQVVGKYITHDIISFVKLIKDYVRSKDKRIKQEQKNELNFLFSEYIGVKNFKLISDRGDWYEEIDMKKEKDEIKLEKDLAYAEGIFTGCLILSFFLLLNILIFGLNYVIGNLVVAIVVAIFVFVISIHIIRRYDREIT